MHRKVIEYELLINLYLFSTIKANGKKIPTMKEEFKLLLMWCCWQSALKTLGSETNKYLK